MLHNNPKEHSSRLHHDYVRLCALYELNFTKTQLWQIILLLYNSVISLKKINKD
jgi:hypothetical protein